RRHICVRGKHSVQRRLDWHTRVPRWRTATEVPPDTLNPLIGLASTSASTLEKCRATLVVACQPLPVFRSTWIWGHASFSAGILAISTKLATSYSVWRVAILIP